MGGRTWQAHERELLEAHVDDDNWPTSLKNAFPNRTEMALKVQMSKLRVELGYADGREIDAGWMVNARQGTRMLGEATLRLGTWS